jgi:hypothetical protein
LRDDRVGVTIKIALPVNLTAGRGVRLLEPSGLALNTPIFGVVGLPDDEEVQSYA